LRAEETRNLEIPFGESHPFRGGRRSSSVGVRGEPSRIGTTAGSTDDAMHDIDERGQNPVPNTEYDTAETSRDFEEQQRHTEHDASVPHWGSVEMDDPGVRSTVVGALRSVLRCFCSSRNPGRPSMASYPSSHCFRRRDRRSRTRSPVAVRHPRAVFGTVFEYQYPDG